ncbi:hypothetical protein ADK36_37350 [Streptomyces viridochromogenes]|nr:hypothetical protein ADK36_37350 [Streptomyces viridochromogenes]
MANSSSLICASPMWKGNALFWLTPMTLTRPACRTALRASSMVVSEPTASTTASGPRPPVISRMAARTSSPSTGSTPRAAAKVRRSATRSAPSTRAAPIAKADWAAMRPTGPRPMTRTVSPGWMRARRQPYQAVGALSVSTMAASSEMPSGRRTRLTSAWGTARAWAWLPGSWGLTP